MNISLFLFGILLASLGAFVLWPAPTETFEIDLANSNEFLTYECGKLETKTETLQNAEAAHEYFLDAVNNIGEQFGPQLDEAMNSEDPVAALEKVGNAQAEAIISLQARMKREFGCSTVGRISQR